MAVVTSTKLYYAELG